MPAWTSGTESTRSRSTFQVVVVLAVLALVAVGGIVWFKSRRSSGTDGPPVVPPPVVDAPPEPPAGPGPNPGSNPGPGLNPLPPAGPGGPRVDADLELGNQLYAKFFVDSQDRTQWERIRELLGKGLNGLSDPAARAPVIEKLDALNKFLVFSNMKTADSVAHKVEPGESFEKIAKAHGLPVDCAMSLSWLNRRMKPENLKVGDSIKVVAPLKMELRVSKKHLRMTAYLNGYFFKEFPVGIGRDDGTPAGEFTVDKKDKDPNWTKTGADGRRVVVKFGDPENILGTRWMSLDGKSEVTGLGIHGTADDSSVPGRVSAGCIRMHNADVELLYDFTPSGSKVTIAEQ